MMPVVNIQVKIYCTDGSMLKISLEPKVISFLLNLFTLVFFVNPKQGPTKKQCDWDNFSFWLGRDKWSSL